MDMEIVDHGEGRGSRVRNPRMKGTRFSRLIVVSLGLLGVVSLIAITALRMHYYSSVISERDQLQTNYRIIISERDQLQTNYSSVITERDQLKKKLALLEPHCLDYWMRFNSSCYYQSNFKNTWVNSQRDCLARGADLVIINSREEQKFLSGFMKEYFWIGLSDRDEEDTWKWVDGTVLTAGFWREGEPNNYGGQREDCVSVYPGHSPSSNWNDYPCSNGLAWVCETRGTEREA